MKQLISWFTWERIPDSSDMIHRSSCDWRTKPQLLCTTILCCFPMEVVNPCGGHQNWALLFGMSRSCGVFELLRSFPATGAFQTNALFLWLFFFFLSLSKLSEAALFQSGGKGRILGAFSSPWLQFLSPFDWLLNLPPFPVSLIPPPFFKNKKQKILVGG